MLLRFAEYGMSLTLTLGLGLPPLFMAEAPQQ